MKIELLIRGLSCPPSYKMMNNFGLFVYDQRYDMNIASILKYIFSCIVLFLLFIPLRAQTPAEKDTFFLAKKRGLLGRIGRSISTDGAIIEPVKTVNPFLKFAGKKINSIEIAGLGLDRNINDSVEVKRSFILRVANALHKNTKEKFVRDNLFFREGDLVVPLMLSDNERFLREQEYLQDALIIILPNINNEDEVDIIVITRDVFSLGGSFGMSSVNKVSAEIKEENLGGMGSKLAISGLYDKARSPAGAVGAEFIKRNINGNFFNWTIGVKTAKVAYSSLRNEETSFYTSIERPLVSRYTRWTGALEWEVNKSSDNYKDVLFDSFYRYNYAHIDIWGGYNIGARRKWMTDHENRLRHFIAVRGFYNHFYQKPLKFRSEYNPAYADINGVLFGYSLFRQNFYRTNFIYGFGRNEDLPVGFNGTLTGGWTNKQGVIRNYYGITAEQSNYSYKKRYYSYIFRAGAFSRNHAFEDVDVLLSADYFTALRKLGSYWRNRNFISAGITKQHNDTLNSPLLLQSDFGLPYYRNGNVAGVFRSTVKVESVFFNMHKFWGFRFAPFVFAGVSFITPKGESFGKTNGYTALGGGFRTRNENLVLGTIEIKAYVFTRKTYPEMKTLRLEASTNLKFKYRSTFIKRPDFVLSN
jgi:hypothetical protein